MRTLISRSEVDFERAYTSAFSQAKKRENDTGKKLDDNEKISQRALNLNMDDVVFDAKVLNEMLQLTKEVE